MTQYVAHNLSPDLTKKAIEKAAAFYTDKYKEYDCKMSWAFMEESIREWITKASQGNL